MSVTQETKDELRRLMAALDEAEARLGLTYAERQNADSAYDGVVIAQRNLGTFARFNGKALLDALAAAEAERDRLRAAAIQARGALRLDAMVDDDGQPFGTTTVAMGAIDASLGDAP